MARSTSAAILSLALCLLVAACDGPPKPAAPANRQAAPTWPQSDKAVTPLLLGNPLPDAALWTLEDTPITLKEAVGGKAAVLVFYRGGWCPF